MEWYHVYLFTRIDPLREFLVPILIISILLSVITMAFTVTEENSSIVGDNTMLAIKRLRNLSITLMCASAFGLVLIPTQKEAAAIWLLPKLAKSDFTKDAAKIPADAMKLVNLKMSQWIEDATVTNEKKEKK